MLWFCFPAVVCLCSQLVSVAMVFWIGFAGVVTDGGSFSRSAFVDSVWGCRGEMFWFTRSGIRSPFENWSGSSNRSSVNDSLGLGESSSREVQSHAGLHRLVHLASAPGQMPDDAGRKWDWAFYSRLLVAILVPLLVSAGAVYLLAVRATRVPECFDGDGRHCSECPLDCFGERKRYHRFDQSQAVLPTGTRQASIR